MYYQDALETARSARWPTTKGKPIDNNTYVILDVDKNGEPEQVRLKYHSTDIIIWKPDGTWYFCTGWESITTKQRLREYGGISIFQADLPSLNGYKVFPRRATYVSVPHTRRCVLFNGNANPDGQHYYSNYIRVKPGFEIDLTTVNPIRIDCIVEPEKLRRRMLHIGKIGKLLVGYVKLKDGLIGEGPMLRQWLLDRENAPINEVALSPFPFGAFRDTHEMKKYLKKTLDDIRWDIARREDWTGQATLLKSV